jgi:hypothetical protein
MESVITKMPIDKLELDNKDFKKCRYLVIEEIKKILTQNPISLAIADIGKPLEFIESETVFEFWKKNKENIAKDLDKIILEDYPNEFAFIASEWISNTGDKLILLEKHH